MKLRMDYEYFKYKLIMKEMSDLKLNAKQKIAWNIINNGENIFITGPGGTGKTEIIKLYKKKNNNKKLIGVTSLTGVSAVLINGTTVHSFLGIGLGTSSVEVLISKILSKSYLKKRWKNLSTLIIDEISMMDPDLFDKIEEIARKIRNSEEPFGGIQLILSGDFCQLPVVKKKEYCFEAKSWNNCVKNIVCFDEIIRQTDKELQICLNNIRMGNITQNDKDLLNSRVGAKLENNNGIKPTQFSATNEQVNEINEKEINILAENGSEFYEYEMKVEIFDNSSDKKYTIDKYMKDIPVVEKLELCIDVQVMLLHNLSIENGLVNGSRGVVVKFIEDKPVVRFLNGEEIVIDFHTWEIENNNEVIMSICQIPLKLGYAFTHHKSQGLTLDYAVIDIGNCFCYGQAYTALSRVKELKGLSIKRLDFNKIKCNAKVLNFYKNLEKK